jgi:hypothetical protein
MPGLYSVRAVLAISTGGEPVLLRSNEQQFSAGGSIALPKSTYGQILWIGDESGSAQINLGRLQKVETGDQFRIRTGYSEFYRLSINKIEPSWSTGVLFPEPLPAESSQTVPWPRVGQAVTLANSKMPVPATTPGPPRRIETSMTDKEKAANVPVVLRVQFISENGADKYGWSKVRLFATLKNESKHTFPDEFAVAHLSTEPGVPPGLCTVYLERYNPDSDERWKLHGGSGKTGISHHAAP